MYKKLLTIGLAFTTLLLTGCGENAKAESTLPESEEDTKSALPKSEEDTKAESALPESKIESLFNSNYTETGNYSNKTSKVIQSQSSFESELSKYTTAVAPQIDFNTNSVLFLSMESQSTGGYAISTDNSRLIITENAVALKVIYNYPGANCLVTQAITQPYSILRIPTKKTILINEEVKTSDCSE
jgi:hypothetical protein